MRSAAKDRTPPSWHQTSLYEKTLNLKLSGNEIYYTAWSLLVKKSCSKLYHQNVSNRISYHMSPLLGIIARPPVPVPSSPAKILLTTLDFTRGNCKKKLLQCTTSQVVWNFWHGFPLKFGELTLAIATRRIWGGSEPQQCLKAGASNGIIFVYVVHLVIHDSWWVIWSFIFSSQPTLSPSPGVRESSLLTT